MFNMALSEFLRYEGLVACGAVLLSMSHPGLTVPLYAWILSHYENQSKGKYI
jgi:hypothetical protein